MKCSECGGRVMCMQHDIYRPDGGSSGTYHCQKCDRTKSWSKKGSGEEIIDMS